MKKAAIYARVSTTDKGQDLDTQLIPLKEFVKNRGWELFKVYCDEVSGAKESRPALDELMKDAHRRKFDCLAVMRFDRFSRSTRQLITALDNFNTLGIDFISLHEAIDTSTSSGRLMYEIIAAFSSFERSIISERVKAGLEKARIKGVRLGRPKANIDVEKMNDLRKQGMSIRAIAKALAIPKSTIYSYLAN